MYDLSRKKKVWYSKKLNDRINNFLIRFSYFFQNYAEEEKEVKITTAKINVYEMVTVKANSEYVIHVKLTQKNKRPDLKVYAPKFSKPKDESWFLTLGEMKRKELLALKRLTFGRRTEIHHNFTYYVPDIEGTLVFFFFFACDGFECEVTGIFV